MPGFFQVCGEIRASCVSHAPWIPGHAAGGPGGSGVRSRTPRTAGSGRTRSPRGTGRSPRWTGRGRGGTCATGHRARTVADPPRRRICGSCPRRSVSQAAQLALDATAPQARFSLASRTIKSASPSSSSGRPGDRGWVHFLVTIRRCQRSNVPGVTTRVQAQAFRQHPGQRREHGPIGPPQPRPGVHPAQHGDLLAQDQNLGVLRRRRPSQRRQPGQHRDTEPVDQTNLHDGPSSQVQAGGRDADVLQA